MLTFLKNMSLNTKVLCIVALPCLGLLGLSFYSITQTGKIGKEIEAIAHQDIPLTEILTKITTHQLEQGILFERAVKSLDEGFAAVKEAGLLKAAD